MEGNGPGNGDGLDMGIAAAGIDVFATDAVIAKTMGFEPLELGFLRYAHDLGMGTADLNEIELLGDVPIESVARQFKPHETTEQQLQWRMENAAELLAA